MASQHAPKPTYPIVEALIGSVTDWYQRRVETAAARSELVACGDDLDRIAHDARMTRQELLELADKGSGASDELFRMMANLGIDAAKINESLPSVMRDLERTCAMCDRKSDCRSDFAHGTAALHYHDYCSNADTLDAVKTAS